MLNGAVNPIFPKEAISDSEKNLDWYKKHSEVGLSIVTYKRDSGLRSDRKEKISNIRLFNDIIDKEEIEAVINPYNFSGKFPDTYKNYPISNSNLNLLFGEERKRLFNPIAYVVNGDIVNSEQDVVTDKFKAFINDQLVAMEFDQDQTKRAIMNLDKWRKFTYQDEFSRMSNQVIQFFLNTTDIREHWSKCFEDLLIQGEEIASVDILGGNLVFERLNPIDVYTFRSVDSYRIEDSDWIVISKFAPIGKIIDDYHDYLSAKDRIKLEEIYMTKTSSSKIYPDGQLLSDKFTVDNSLEYLGFDGVKRGNETGVVVSNKHFDAEGNCRVTRTLWKGQRKLGILKYKDNEGKNQKKYVDEKYKPNKEEGENIEYEYISEWYEITQIGADIFVKHGPRPIQFRDPDNPSICHPGIIGNVLNTNSSQAKSLLSYMKPYQLLYNFFMYRLQQDFIKYQGHIAKMNMSMKPDKFTTEKWMYYIQQFGIMFEDPFNEGMDGAATGKLSGALGYNQGGSTQIGDANLIQMNMEMLGFLENRIADISGVTPQRKGAIDNRETVGGVERSVMQSSNNTEKYFGLHDNFRLRCLRTIVETAKIAWKDKKEKRMFVLDDGTKSILDFDGESFKMGVYGVATSTSSDVTNMMNDMKTLSQSYMQNGGSMSAIIDIYQTKDPSSLKRKLEQYEEEVNNRAEQTEKRNMEMQQQQIESMKEVEAARMEHERLLNEMDNNTKLQIALLNQTEEDNTVELEKLKIQSDKIDKDLKFKELQLRETIRHNQNAESISRIQKQKPNK